MTTATAPTTWPTKAELNRVSGLIAEAYHALNGLELTAYRFIEDVRDEDRPALPTLEELGALSLFIEVTKGDVEGMGKFLDELREAHHMAAITLDAAALTEDDDAR